MLSVSSSTSNSTSVTTNTNMNPIHPSPPSYYNPSSWTLMSQGAEARIWYISNFITVDHEHEQQQHTGNHHHPSAAAAVTAIPSHQPTTTTVVAICKERFPKAYRHVLLDRTLTKARTKAEARNIVKCRKAGIDTPAIYLVQLQYPSSCLFMEYITGCTVKQYLETHMCTATATSVTADKELKMMSKNKVEEEDIQSDVDMEQTQDEDQKNHQYDGLNMEESMYPTTDSSSTLNDDDDDDDDDPSSLLYTSHKVIINSYSISIAQEMGTMIATMHHANIIHGDLTTSNIMIRNPPSISSSSSWKHQLVLIDLGLSSTCSSTKNTSSIHTMTGSVTGQEEKAVDLYVMERAFQTTHPGSEVLITYLLQAYQQQMDTLSYNHHHHHHTSTNNMMDSSSSSSSSSCTKIGNTNSNLGMDQKNISPIRKNASYGQSILERLNLVRLRGRKRECFG